MRSCQRAETEEKTEKQSMTKKGHRGFGALKWKFFPKKGHPKKCGRLKFFPSPQTRRQVSAHGDSQ